MEIKTSRQNGQQLIQIIGNLDSNSVNQAQEAILPLLSEKSSMVLDLEGCNYISSAGLRLLLMTAKQLSTQGGVLVLSGLNDEIKDVMEITGFSHFFRTFVNVEAAIEAIQKEGSCSG